jgi:hypothetical protein
MDLIEADGKIHRRSSRLAMLLAEVIEQLVAGDGQVPDTPLEEVPSQGRLRCNDQFGRLRPVADLTEEGAESAQVLLIRPLMGPYLGYGEAEHALKVRGER